MKGIRQLQGNQQTFVSMRGGIMLLGICWLLSSQCAFLTYRIENDPAYWYLTPNELVTVLEQPVSMFDGYEDSKTYLFPVHDVVPNDDPFSSEDHWPYFYHTHSGVDSITYIPDVLTDKQEEIIEYARELRENNNLQESINLLATALSKDSLNQHLLYEIGRMCYLADSLEASFKYYKRLFARIDELFAANIIGGHPGPEYHLAVMDSWYDEAYLALVIMHIQREEYEEGLYEIARGLTAHFRKDLAFLENALCYTAYAWFQLGNYEYGNKVGQYAVKLFPKNSVLQSIDHRKRYF